MLDMKIAYLINQYPKVSHSFIRREIQALEQDGVEVLRIAIRGWSDELADPADAQERTLTRYLLERGWLPLLWAVTRMALTRPAAFLSALRLATRMGRRSDRPLPVHWVYLAEACAAAAWAEAAGVRHVHAHFATNPAEVAMLMAALGGMSYSFTAHGTEAFDHPRFIGLAEKIRRAAFVVAVSSHGRSQLYRLVDTGHWPKIHVVGCGLDPEFARGAPTEPHPVDRLVCVGRLSEEKGQLLLLDALRRVIDAGHACELVLGGDGEMRGVIQQRIDELGLGPSVRITGWISGAQVREEILQSRALILPSFAEGLPVVIMEAMALRRPVISTYVGGIPELVQPGECGWLVPAGDVDSMAQAMRQCLGASAEQLRMMGNAACERVRARHDVRDGSTRLRALLSDHVGGKV